MIVKEAVRCKCTESKPANYSIAGVYPCKKCKMLIEPGGT